MAETARAHALSALLAIGGIAPAFRGGALLAIACVTFGCGDDDPSAHAGDGGSAVDAGTWPMDLGKGELAFAPLADGEALPYVHGPQGGQHVWIAFRMRDLAPARVLVQVTTAVEGYDELVLQRRGRVNFERAATASPRYEYAGWPAQILGAVDHEGERVQIDVVLEDREGRRARAGATIEIAGTNADADAGE